MSSSDKHLNILSLYLKKKYGVEITNKLLLRIFLIEITLKNNNFDTINTSEYFYVIYCVFKYITEEAGDKVQNINLIDTMNISIYIIYSYFGCDTGYFMSDFFDYDEELTAETTTTAILSIKEEEIKTRKRNYSYIVYDIICNTNISNLLLSLNLI